MDALLNRLNNWWESEYILKFTMIDSYITARVYIKGVWHDCITIYWEYEKGVNVPHIISKPTENLAFDQYIRYYILRTVSASAYPSSIFIIQITEPLTRYEIC